MGTSNGCEQVQLPTSKPTSLRGFACGLLEFLLHERLLPDRGCPHAAVSSAEGCVRGMVHAYMRTCANAPA